MNKWTNRCLGMAGLVSTWSKDPSSRVGAVIVAPTGQIVAQGYNGFPRGIADTEERLNDRDKKYLYVVHAEKNAIYNAGWNGASTKDCTIYVEGLPVCSECAKGIIQTGIKRVVVRTKRDIATIWKLRWEESREMFEEAGIAYERYYDDGTLAESHSGRDEPVGSSATSDPS